MKKKNVILSNQVKFETFSQKKRAYLVIMTEEDLFNLRRYIYDVWEQKETANTSISGEQERKYLVLMDNEQLLKFMGSSYGYGSVIGGQAPLDI